MIKKTGFPVIIILILILGILGCPPEPRYFTLSVSVSGTGSVAISPQQDEYLEGTTVTLTASSDDPDYTFSYWQGDLSGSNSTTTIQMNQNYSITAVFSASSATVNYTGPDAEVFEISDVTSTNLDLTIDLGSNTRDVYFVFTNTSATDGTQPTVNGSSVGSAPLNQVFSRSSSLLNTAPVILHGKPEISEYNSNFKDRLASGSTGNLSESVYSSPTKPLFDTYLQTADFIYDLNVSSTVSATCRSVTTDGNKTLNIWVANDCWEGSGVKSTEVNQEMVDAMAERFLDIADSDEDIYNWVTNIYGEEWGPTIYDNLIGENNEITILLMDIDADDAPNGGVVGYFWSKDNLLKTFISQGSETGLPSSNERVMFYMDAVMFANDNGADEGLQTGDWDETDYWPQVIFSTLGHEFQHMIHFYQKSILQTAGAGTDDWINEMCSEVTEDFISTKLQVNGPRGVAYADATAGDDLNNEGRLPWFNNYSDLPLAEWYYGTNNSLLIAHYGISYSFGAYLARNFGGVELFRNIVQNDGIDSSAITEALVSQGYTDESFETVLGKWGAAVLLSDTANAPAGYEYNSGTWFDSTLGGETYSLGSINLFNYDPEPIIDTTAPVGTGDQEGTSNLYYQYGTGLSGTLNTVLSFGINTKLTVVIK